jgi:hypothetical protein
MRHLARDALSLPGLLGARRSPLPDPISDLRVRIVAEFPVAQTNQPTSARLETGSLLLRLARLEARLEEESAARRKLERSIEDLIAILSGGPDDVDNAQDRSLDPFDLWVDHNLDFIREHANSFIALHLKRGEAVKVTTSAEEIGAFSAGLTDSEREEVMVFHTSTINR